LLTNLAEQAQYGGGNTMNIADERRKILDGTYSSRVIQGRQNKHIYGTIEFEQKREQIKNSSPGSEPAILTADAQDLINKYKGTGSIYFANDSPYPREIIDTSVIIGKSWVKSLQKYVETTRFEIFYSSTGVHIIPKNDHKKR
jgi:hypothetical protein